MRTSNGFTLIELMVVIAIIGVLASVSIASLSEAREKANVAKTIQDMRGIQTNISIYTNHTNSFPPRCDAVCNSGTDPFLNSLGARGWNGPYQSVWDRAHPWGGSYSISQYDTYQDGSIEMIIVLDDDRPGTNYSDNQGAVPLTALLAIDKIFDDGDLATGRFVGDSRDTLGPGATAVCPVGEGCWIIDF